MSRRVEPLRFHLRAHLRIGSKGRALAPFLVSVAALVPAQAQSSPPHRSVDAPLRLIEAGNGFGLLLPHRTTVPDGNGLPTGQMVEIRTLADLDHLTPANPILPNAEWPSSPVLPNAIPGNHFLVARFDRALDVDSILTSAAAAAPRSNLTGAIRVERVDPLTGVRKTLRGRAFVGGKTYGSPDPLDSTRLLLETWVAPGGGGTVTAVDPRGLGFPGTQGDFANAELLADPRSFVFVPDADDDLASHETFPSSLQIQMRITKEARARSGGSFEGEALASGTVGADGSTPEVLVRQGGVPSIVPGDGATGVDPRTNVVLGFSEPIQLLTVGPLVGRAPGLSPAVQIRFGPPSASVSVPFTLRPRSVYDLSLLVLDPAYDLPGSGPVDLGFDDFASIQVSVHASQLEDLAANQNTRARSVAFRTAPGAGLVNAPVTPDTIYVARTSGISVIDLNGYGAGTGNPAYSLFHPIVQGNSNYPNNPNLALQGAALVPPLSPGTSTFNGGSSGVFTLTRDSNLGNLLAGAPTLSSVGDMALGHALDGVYNNGAPFGCAAGGGNLCASTGLKRVQLAPGGPNTLIPALPGQLPIQIVVGSENLASWAPHPNPPPLVFPPLCLGPQILGQEPTSVLTSLPQPDGAGLTNLLIPGPFPLGIPAIELPPQGLLSLEQNAFFQGPGVPQPSVAQCPTFGVRQQIGQFLYVVDRAAGEVVVLNSNRFLVLDRIAVPDPTALAMSPNLDLLAVSSEGTDQVFFLDIDPSSTRFHQIVHTTAVGDGPRGLAWESGNEDLFVCCTLASSVYVLSAFTLGVRKVLTEHLSSPIDLALTPRQVNFGFARGVYFAYILNADGTVAVFESGPSGVNGIGFDEVLGILPFEFHSPVAIQPDVRNLNSAFFVLHQDPLQPNGEPSGVGGGALTNVAITGGIPGPQPIPPGALPGFRNLQLGIQASIGEGLLGLSGVPVDLAFDNQRNLSALTNFTTQHSAGQPLSVNGKSLVKPIGGTVLPVSAPQFLFVAVPNPGVVDVFCLLDGALERSDTNPFEVGFQSIPVAGVTGLMDYFRQ